jgi:hypothetical protein
MKSPAIFLNKCGFLTLEALIALAVMTLIVPAALSLSWSNNRLAASARMRLDSLSNVADVIQNGAIRQIASSSLLYQHEFGKSTCNITPSDPKKGFVSADIYNTSILGSGITGTSVTARNGFIYETTDSSSQSAPDFFIIDARNPASPIIVSSLNTGPGLSAVTVSGYYVYVANESSLSQLQVIDIHDRTHPFVAAKLKLPLPDASSTAPSATSLFYDDGMIYLGTEKWNGLEFNAIDVSNPTSPMYRGGFETGSLVNAIYEYGGYAYVAGPDTEQMRILDVHDPTNSKELSYFSPPGFAVLEGKTFALEDNTGNTIESNTKNSTSTLYFARAGGGFNNTSQYELFSFNVPHDTPPPNPIDQSEISGRDIPGGVYGVVAIPGFVFLATGDSSAGFQIWRSDLGDLSAKTVNVTLPGKPLSLWCDHGRLYSALADQTGFMIIIPR